MSAKRALTPEQIEQAARLYQAGKSTREIGEQFHVHQTTVSTWLRKSGVQMRKSRYPVRYLEAEDVLKTTQLAAQGFSNVEMGRLLGVHPSTIRARLRRYARDAE